MLTPPDPTEEVTQEGGGWICVLDAHSSNILGEDMLDTRKENSSEVLHSPKGEVLR